MIEAGVEIRAVLVCPKCKERGVIRAIHADCDPGGVALRLVCEGRRLTPDGTVRKVESRACGVLGVFMPPDAIVWSQGSKAEAAVVLQEFLDTTEIPENAVDMLAFAQRKNERIEELENEIRQMAQMVHRVYHETLHDPCSVTWESCPRGLCQRAQHVLGVVS